MGETVRFPTPEPGGRPDGDPRYRLLTVVVPAYNERNTVGEILRRMRRVELPIEREIVVVDDGSTDGTDKVLSALEDSTVRVVRHDRNRGKGACIRTGLGLARGDLILTQDADLEYDPDDWPKLLAPVLKGRATVVYGSRVAGERRSSSLWPVVGDRLISIVTDVLYNTTLTDVETGYKLFDRKVLESVELTADGFDFEPEVTAKLLRAGHRIYEVPVSYAGRGRDEGKKITWRDTTKALGTLARLRVGR